jgi:hypothetical protein
VLGPRHSSTLDRIYADGAGADHHDDICGSHIGAHDRRAPTVATPHDTIATGPNGRSRSTLTNDEGVTTMYSANHRSVDGG